MSQVSLPAVADTTRQQQQQQSSWQVCVLRMQVACGWSAGTKLFHEFITPPIPLAGNACKQLYNGLHHHPLVRPLHKARHELLALSKLRIALHESDGHLANEKLHYFLYSQEVEERSASGRKPVYTDLLLCRNHQINLIMTGAVASMRRASTGKSLICNLYAASLFLRMGGHFTRLVANVRCLAKRMVDWVVTPSGGMREAAEHNIALGKELSSYLKDNLPMNAREMSRTFREGAPAASLCRP